MQSATCIRSPTHVLGTCMCQLYLLASVYMSVVDGLGWVEREAMCVKA